MAALYSSDSSKWKLENSVRCCRNKSEGRNQDDLKWKNPLQHPSTKSEALDGKEPTARGGKQPMSLP